MKTETERETYTETETRRQRQREGGEERQTDRHTEGGVKRD